MMPKLEIRLFGEFSIAYSDEKVHSLNANRLQSLLTYLLIYRHSPQPRQQLASHLWPETSEKQARTNLRNLLFQLKKAFPSYASFLYVDRTTIQWRNDAEFTLDIAQFESLLDVDKGYAVVASSPVNGDLLGRYQESITVYRGDLVPSLYDEWASHERERLRQLYLSALQICSHGLEVQQAYDAAIQVTNRLVSAEPSRESAYCQLMRLHAYNRDSGAIHYAYRRCTTHLAQELGIEPSRDTLELRDKLLQSIVAGTISADIAAWQSMQNNSAHSSTEIGSDDSIWSRNVRAAKGAREEQTVDGVQVDGVPAETLTQPAHTGQFGTPELPAVYRRLVGRQSEWSMLREAWQQTQNGQSHCVVIRGEAGIGKSRLAEELVTWVRKEGASVAASHCYTAQKNIPYGPVVRWLRSPTFASALTMVDRKWLTEVARLLPELGRDIPNFEAAGPITEGWQRRHLFDSLSRIVAATQEPLLLLIDDIQWSDVESLEWLSSLLNELQAIPATVHSQTSVLLLATLRDEEIHDTPVLQTWNDDLQRRGLRTDISLGPLNHQNTLRLASDISVASLSGKEGTKLFEQTEGHPLYIVESVRAGLYHGTKAIPEVPTATSSITKPSTVESPTIQSVIKNRFRLLSESTRMLLNLASVIGREFSYQLLVDASSFDEASIIDGLDEALARGVVREREAETYDFSHVLLREALYDELSNARRRFYHKTLAEVLETSVHETMDAMAAQIALHFEKSGNLAKAVDYYLRSAAAAQNVYANEEALSYYQHLLSATFSSSLTVANRCHILAESGQIWLRIGQWHDAVSHFNQLLELAKEEAQIRYQAVAYLGLARLEQRQGRNTEALEPLQHAHDSFTACHDLQGLADTLHLMGNIHFFLANIELARQAHEAQQKIGEELGSVLIQCRAQWAQAREFWIEGNHRQALEICQAAFEQADQHDLLEMKATLANSISSIFSKLGDANAHWTWRITALNYVQSLGNQRRINDTVHGLMFVYSAFSDFAAVRQCALYALANSIKIRDLNETAFTLINYAHLSIQNGRFDLVETFVKLTLSLAEHLKRPEIPLVALETLASFYLETEQFAKSRTFAEQHPNLIDEIDSSGVVADSTYAITYHVMVAREKLLAGAAADEALSTLRQMLVEAQSQPDPKMGSIANLHYRIWSLDPSQKNDQEEAAKLYHTLYEKRPSNQFRQRYQQLTGVSLPEPAPLELPAIITEETYDLEVLLAQVKEWLAELQLLQRQNTEQLKGKEIAPDESVCHSTVPLPNGPKRAQPVDKMQPAKSDQPKAAFQ